MHLTRFTDYSLRVLMYLSQQNPDDKVSLEFLSEHFNMNRHHLNKVSQRLAALKWVRSVRGKNGGLMPEPSVINIPLGKLVAELEPDTRPMDCIGVACPLAGNCELECILTGAGQAFLQYLDQYTLADLGRSPNMLQVLHL